MAANTTYDPTWVNANHLTDQDREAIYQTPQRLHMREVFSDGRALKLHDVLIYKCKYGAGAADVDCHLTVRGFTKVPKFGYMPDLSAVCHPAQLGIPAFLVDAVHVKNATALKAKLVLQGLCPVHPMTTNLELHRADGNQWTYKEVCGAYKNWLDQGNPSPFVRH